MGRCVRRRVCRDIVKIGSAESTNGTVGHGFAPSDGGFIFKVEESVGLRRSMETFGVPGYTTQIYQSLFILHAQLITERRNRSDDYPPILDRRLSSSALRLMNPAGLADRHLAVGNMV